MIATLLSKAEFLMRQMSQMSLNQEFKSFQRWLVCIEKSVSIHMNLSHFDYLSWKNSWIIKYLLFAKSSFFFFKAIVLQWNRLSGPGAWNFNIILKYMSFRSDLKTDTPKYPFQQAFTWKILKSYVSHWIFSFNSMNINIGIYYHKMFIFSWKVIN